MNNIKTYKLLAAFSALLLTGCYNLDESGLVINGTDAADVIYSETFEDNLGDFIVKNVSGSQSWSYYSSGYAIISGYANKVNYANEDWLISPEIDLTKVSAAKLIFDYVLYKGNPSSDATVWVTDNYQVDSVMKTENWIQIKFDVTPDGGSYTFITSDELSLTAFAGKKIRIALRYTSTSTSAGTLEVRNFTVKSGEAYVKTPPLYSESFSSSLGTFFQYSVTGDEKWYVTNSYAYMTGYVSNANKANEDWLISAEIDLSQQTAANFSFDHVARYFANLSTEATVWISENYVSGTRPDSVSDWVKVATSPFKDPESWTFLNSLEISLTPYCGKKIHIAFKYISTSTKAGSWEIKNFKVYSGEANGTTTDPYTIAEASAAQTGGLGWIEGYVVGYSWPFLTQYKYYFGTDTCTQTANIILADSLSEKYISRCLSVQLPRGGVRNNLNLKTNKTIYGQKVKVYGTLSANNGISGIVSPTAYILADGTIGGATEPIFTIPFTSGLGAFTTVSVTGDQMWGYDASYGAKMLGYSAGSSYENEDWLISPEIDLTNISSAAITFDHAINKGLVANVQIDHTVLITTNNGVDWTPVTGITYPPGNVWTFFNAGEVVIDNYVGNKIKIAFRYKSSTSSAATWEIKNFKIY